MPTPPTTRSSARSNPKTNAVTLHASVTRKFPSKPISAVTPCAAKPISLGHGVGALHTALDVLKKLHEAEKAVNLVKGMSKAGQMAAHFGPDLSSVAVGKNFLRQGKSFAFKGVALGIALDGLLGGLDSLSRNADRKDLSASNKIGRVGAGVATGLLKGAASTAGGALAGAAIGAAFGSIVPGAGTVAGAVLGAKVGAMVLSPAAAIVTDKIVNKLLPKDFEERAGQMADRATQKVEQVAHEVREKAGHVAESVKGALIGAAGRFLPHPGFFRH
jgi:phage tail tape-measure protein